MMAAVFVSFMGPLFWEVGKNHSRECVAVEVADVHFPETGERRSLVEAGKVDVGKDGAVGENVAYAFCHGGNLQRQVAEQRCERRKTGERFNVVEGFVGLECRELPQSAPDVGIFPLADEAGVAGPDDDD